MGYGGRRRGFAQVLGIQQLTTQKNFGFISLFSCGI